MVKKIIALSVAFVLMLTSVLWGTVNVDKSPVQFGAGEGTSKVVESTADLEALLSNIPSVKDYLTNSSILDINANFKPFTMVETGKAVDEFKTTTTHEGEPVWKQTVSTREHSLEICFTATAVYYHAVGEMSSDENLWEKENLTSDYINTSEEYYISGESTKTTYDIEIYYSSEVMLVKYNDYSIGAYTATERDEWVESTETSDDSFEMDAALNIVTSSFGKWMKVEQLEEGAMPDTMPDSTDAMIDMLVQEFCYQFSTTVIDSITSSTEANTVYLAGLAGFIVGNSSTHFKKEGNSYKLKDGEYEENHGYDDDYLTAIGVNPNYYKSASGSASYNLNSDIITVGQYISLSSGNRNQTIDTNTTFQNIDNTVVSLKDVAINSVEDVLGAGFKKYLEENMPEGGMQ